MPSRMPRCRGTQRVEARSHLRYGCAKQDGQTPYQPLRWRERGITRKQPAAARSRLSQTPSPRHVAANRKAAGEALAHVEMRARRIESHHRSTNRIVFTVPFCTTFRQHVPPRTPEWSDDVDVGPQTIKRAPQQRRYAMALVAKERRRQQRTWRVPFV